MTEKEQTPPPYGGTGGMEAEERKGPAGQTSQTVPADSTSPSSVGMYQSEDIEALRETEEQEDADVPFLVMMRPSFWD